MGIYSELQEKISNAFDTSLLDATRNVQFINYTSVYDTVTMENALTEISSTLRCVRLRINQGDILDEASFKDTARYLILDQDRDGFEFILEQKVVDGTDEFKIKEIKSDPVGASWTVDCRKLN